MIIDCHAHVFQHWAGPCGHSSREIHRRYMQKVQTRTSSRVFRVRDGTEVSGSLLFHKGRNGWSGLKDVNFRVGIYGRLDFMVDGEDYSVQYMPVGMQEIVAPPELMLANMMVGGVDHAVLQAGGGYGAMNDYNAFAQTQYPERFTALLNLDEARAHTKAGLAELERAHRSLGLNAVYFALDGFARYDFDIRFDSPALEPFWSRVNTWKLPVFFEAPPTPDYDGASYVANMIGLKRLMDSYTDIRWVLVMGPPVGLYGMSGRWEFPDEVLAAYRHPNLLIEVMFPITWGGRWDYPYPEAQALLRGMRDLFGADKLVWGSDAPNVERFCTYKQSLDYVRRHSTFLTAGEKDRILGGNVDRLLGISERLARRRAPGTD
ncbi:amidohydrolase family protein [Elioraea sp.]|uniref:amidohydrolase family protein n=1 Tax=Elioraea sp. TaxID=2185103 RepID=UPI003F71F93C